jgi:hypothetical protein
MRKIFIYFLFLFSIFPQSQKKQIPQKEKIIGLAFFVSEPVYFKDTKSNSLLKNLSGASKINEFIFVSEKILSKHNSYYKVFMPGYSRSMRMDDQDRELFEAFVKAKNIRFFTPQEFTEYTMENSDFNRKNLLEQIQKFEDFKYPLNFTNIKIKKMKTSGFELIWVSEGYSNSNSYGSVSSKSYVIKNETEVVPGGLNLYFEGITDLDLDDDGMPEIYQSIITRTAYDTPVFFGYVDGKYKPISLNGKRIDFKNKFIYSNSSEFNAELKKPDSKMKKYKYYKGIISEE